MWTLSIGAALAATVCEVPVPAGLVVEAQITYESAWDQVIQVSNSPALLADAAVFSSADGEFRGTLWSGGRFFFRAVHEEGRELVASDCLVRRGRGEVIIGFEDSVDGDYNDVRVVLRPDPNTCTVPLPAGLELDVDLSFNAGYQQLIQVGSGLLSPTDVAEFSSLDGDRRERLTAPGPITFRAVHEEPDGRIRSNRCLVRREGDTMVIGFEDADDGDYNDVQVRLTRR